MSDARQSELGSIFADHPSGRGGKGADLEVDVTLGRAALRTGQPIEIDVARALPDRDGVLRERVPSPHDNGWTIALSLPADVSSGVILRLRGQGARTDAGVGDLYVRVTVDESMPLVAVKGPGFPWLLAGLGAGAATALSFCL